MVGDFVLYKVEGLSFLTFPKTGWGSSFPHKKGGVAKIGACFKNEGITYFHTN